MSKQLPFFKFDTDSWLTGKIQLLTATEKGIFIDLIARIWHENGQLKNDEILHRLLRVEKATLSDALQAFFDLGIMKEKDGILCVKFIDDQIKTHNEFIEKQREFGAKGGRPKKGTKANKERRNKKEEIRKEIEELRNDNPPIYTPTGGKEGETNQNYDECPWLIPDEELPPELRFTPEEKAKLQAAHEAELEACKNTAIENTDPKTFSEKFISLKNRINALFRRRETTQWDVKEIALLRKIISSRPDVISEMNDIEKLYNSGYQYARRDIKTFLNNWTTEYDRSLNIKPRRLPGV